MSTSAPPPRVSVVMIFRDAERYFEEAIASVLAQTLPELELLLCDDGSSDASTAIARRRAEQDPDRVRYLEHDQHAHRGMSATRNLGIGAARGAVVAFLDADDIWQPGHLAHELALLEAHPDAGAVCGRALDWFSWADPDAVDRWSPLPWPPGVVVGAPGMLTAVLRRGAYSTPTCSLMIRRSVLAEVGGGDDAFTALFEDQVLLAKLYLNVSCVLSGTATAYYRRHDASSTALAQRAGEYHPNAPNRSHEAFLRWLADRPELQRPEADYVELRRLLDAALVPYDGRPEGGGRGRALRTALPAPLLGGARRVVDRVTRRWPWLTVWPLRRTRPVSRQFGYDRGQPVDRYYIETFLAAHAHLVAGRVLEVGDDGYTRAFGGPRVVASDVLNIDASIPGTTIAADLADGAGLESEAYDCLIVTQTLHLIYDMPAAVRTMRRILKPGGTLLLTVPGITPVSTDRWAETWFWSLTPHATTRLLAEVFGTDAVEVESWGNVLASAAFLEGLAAEDLRPHELQTLDPQFPLVVTARAVRPVESVG